MQGVRRRARADVVAITMGRGRFRMLVLVGVLLVGGAFGGGVWFGRGMLGADREEDSDLEPVAAVADVKTSARAVSGPVPGPGPGTKPKPKPAPVPEPETGPGNSGSGASLGFALGVPPTKDGPTNEAALELARIGGTAPPPRVEIRDDAPDDGFGLQLGAYPSREEAERFVQTHAEALGDRRVHVVASEVPNKGTWYRVRIGHFDSKRVARRARRGLTEELRSTSIVVSYR